MGELPRGWEKGRILAWRFILEWPGVSIASLL
jgi:hypothetical protein